MTEPETLQILPHFSGIFKSFEFLGYKAKIVGQSAYSSVSFR